MTVSRIASVSIPVLESVAGVRRRPLETVPPIHLPFDPETTLSLMEQVAPEA